jgi:aspartate aminotransferase
MRFREEVGESLTLKFAESAAKRREMGLPIISLGLGEPDFQTPPEIISATKAVLDSGSSRYSSPLGVMGFRELVAQKLNSENSINCTAENILISAGAKQAYQILAMALLEPGDEVVVVAPAFVSFVPQLLLAEPDCVVKTLNVNPIDFSFPLEKLAETVSDKTRLIIINSPNNPAGYVLKEDEVKEIFGIAQKHNCYLLSDEIYEKLNFSNTPHLSAGSLEHQPSRVITINGYSKSHAMTGWRVGYACFPSELKTKILKIQQHTNTNTCTFIQQGLAQAGKLDESYLKTYRAALSDRCSYVMKWAESNDRIRLRAPDAGFFAFFDISNLNMSSNDFCGAAIEKAGVAMTPGIAFGKSWDTHVRLSFAVPQDTLERGLGLLSEFIEEIDS